MILLKLLGAGVLFLSGCGLSLLVCEKKGKSLLEIQSFEGLFRHLRREIECYRRTIPLALASVPKDVARGCLGGEKRMPEELTDFINVCPMRAEGLSGIVEGAARELGQGNLAEQLRILDATALALATLYQKEEKRVHTEQGTARVACLGSAAFLAILLL